MKKLIFSIALLATIFVACDDDNSDSGSDVSELTLNISNLENLGDDYVYEGWVIVDEVPITTGVFTVDDEGVLSQTVFEVATEDLEAAAAFVLSIEPTVDPDPAPAATKLLQGVFSEDTADVSSNNMVADLTTSSGQYFLATPTDGEMNNEYSGIWFADNSSGAPDAPGLVLPALTPGWIYEGWVVIDGTPISTGTFIDPTLADNNASTSPYKGTVNDGPPYPGEDFIMGSVGGIVFPLDLRGYTAVISVEPVPDNSAAPFALKPLAGTIGAEPTTLQDLGEGPLVEITGTVTR